MTTTTGDSAQLTGPVRVSLDNGNRYYTLRDLHEMDEDVLEEKWGALEQVMDDGIREQTHDQMAPCGFPAFLRRYLEIATRTGGPESHDLVIG